MIRTFRDYGALLVALSLIVVAQKGDWRVELPMGSLSEPACQEIILPALATEDEGFLGKAVEPHTNDLGGWALFLDGKVEGPYLFTVTAYNEDDPYTPGSLTASGLPVIEGITVACGPELELGTVVILENGMVVRCLDRGGWITQGRLDIYFDDLSEAQRFGIQRLRGVILR